MSKTHRSADWFFILFYLPDIHIPGNLAGKRAFDIYQPTGGKRGSES